MARPDDVPKEESVNLREAKANLSGLTRQAREGIRVVITNHGTPIADLVAHGTGRHPAGHLKRPGPLPKAVKLKGKGPTASELVLLDRED